MGSFTIQVQDESIKSLLERLIHKGEDIHPVLQTIGDGIVERAKHRFETSTAPDGTAWKANSEATLQMLAERIGGYKSYRKQNGALNSRGAAKLAGKRPLIGESGDLWRQIAAVASGDEVTVGTSPIYAAIHQFGGTIKPKKGKALNLGGRLVASVTIPARPYLPVRSDGSLYPQESAQILDTLNEFLMDGL